MRKIAMSSKIPLCSVWNCHYFTAKLHHDWTQGEEGQTALVMAAFPAVHVQSAGCVFSPSGPSRGKKIILQSQK